MRRREAIAAAGTFVLGGCLSSFNSNHQSAGEDAWIERETYAAGNGEGWTGTIELEPGEFTAGEWRAWGSAGIVAGVGDVDSGRVDIWTIPENSIGDYQSGNDVPFVENMSASGVREETVLSANVSGTYWIAFDNTPAYGTTPDGTFRGDVAMGAGRL